MTIDSTRDLAAAPSVDCICVGILVADHLCAPIDHLPRPGELVLSERLPLSIGGCAATTAMDLARLEVSVGVAGCVGQDFFGRFLIDTLAEAGIETSAVRQREDIHTSATLIINVAGEDRRYVHTIGANAVLAVDDIPLDRVRQAKVLYVGGYLLAPGLEQAGKLEHLFGQARAAGVKTVLDVVVPGPGDHWSKLRGVLSQTDLFLPNDDEAGAITGIADPLEQAEFFRKAGARTVVITCGGRGTLLVDGQQRLRAGVFPTTFVGGTGAGDAFDAGFIRAMLDGEDAASCLAWGSALGASCVRSVSATESVFYRHEAREFLARHRLMIERV